jgi:hypothetical protein
MSDERWKPGVGMNWPFCLLFLTLERDTLWIGPVLLFGSARLEASSLVT